MMERKHTGEEKQADERMHTGAGKQTVRLTIEMSADGVKSVSQLAGELYSKENAQYLRYEEYNEDSGKTATTIKLAPGFIKIIRRGQVASELTFIPQQTTAGRLETPHGGWKLDVRTSSLSSQLNGGEGTCFWTYDLFDQERHLGTFEFIVHVNFNK